MTSLVSFMEIFRNVHVIILCFNLIQLNNNHHFIVNVAQLQINPNSVHINPHEI